MSSSPAEAVAIEQRTRDQRAGSGRLALAQAKRQGRVIAAALELAAERGDPDTIQMRDIAERSQVALGTIYKYFSSKDEVLAVALISWTSRLDVPAVPAVVDESPLVERAVAVLRRASQSVEREPALVRTLFLAAASKSGRARGLGHDLGPTMSTSLTRVLAGMDDDTRRGVERVLAHVWYSALMRWVNGWHELNEIGDELEFACRMLLSGPSPATEGSGDRRC